MKKAIIIPVYLRLTEPDDLLDLQEVRLTGRAIESLRILDDQDFSLVLPVCTDMDGEEKEGDLAEVDRLLKDEVGRLRKENTLIFSSHHLKDLQEFLRQRDLRNFYPLIDLKGYSKIRNTGLLLAQATAADVAVFIDNDEVVEDPAFLNIACEFLNDRVNGKRLQGKGGFYVNGDGNILLPPQRLWWKFLWNKTRWMNRVWESILSSQDRLVSSPILLGGNLTLHRTLFRHVPFDPYIPRGEDTDYLINASQLGYGLLFDRELRIRHLHPERTEAYFQEELRGDIERFLYERRKVNPVRNSSGRLNPAGIILECNPAAEQRGIISNGVNVGPRMALDPYPGRFLNWTLYPRAILSSFFLGLDYLGKGQWRKAGECMKNLQLFFHTEDGGWVKYLRFRADWERAMEIIQREGMDELLEGCWI